MVADRDARAPRADLLDDPGRLVAEHDRHRIAQRALDDLEIGVAQPGRLDPHQHVVAALSGPAVTVSIFERGLGRVQDRGAVGEGHPRPSLTTVDGLRCALPILRCSAQTGRSPSIVTRCMTRRWPW